MAARTLIGAPGADNVVDQVKRREVFEERHPRVQITSPRQNGALLWRATWIEEPTHPDDEGAVAEITSHASRFLLDRLEERFDGK